ncbi:MAG: NADP-dependent isocitrate dehydrogenase, partial [Rhodospirillales bacterium]
TKVDEAPALAAFSLLPIVQAFVGVAGLDRKKTPYRSAAQAVALLLEAALSLCLVGLRLVRGVKSGSGRASPSLRPAFGIRAGDGAATGRK